ncbi:MAG: FmdB family zinc ribbon protein [Jatrophihabitans sp.]|uniref:FmdB family zinc ribbon protein n=1 Tax=Jatrophihabitans sp. TaxID=1932789 RepID=UPI003914C9B1
MPTYQYACTDADCGNQFELVQSFTDPAASECPVCGSRVRKVFSAVGVVFKGSGFYRTDSRAGAGKSSESSSASDSKDSGSKSKEPATASTPSSSSSSPSSDSSSGSSSSSSSSSSSTSGKTAASA